MSAITRKLIDLSATPRRQTVRPWRAARGAWRRLRNHCERCGVSRAATWLPADIHSWGRYCRVCNKRAARDGAR